MPELTRRAVVRAGVGAVWAAPVVTLATAAPALAASPGSVTVTGFAAAYSTGGTPLTVDPHTVVVGAQIHYSGTDPVPLTFRLEIEPGIFEEMGVAAGPGFAVSSVTGDYDAGWAITFARTEQLSSSDSSAVFSATLTPVSPPPPPRTPFTGCPGGVDFRLSGTAIAGAATMSVVFDATAVEKSEMYPSCGLDGIEVLPTSEDPGTPSRLTLWANSVAVADSTATAVDQLFILVYLPQIPDSPLGALPQDPVELHDAWSFVGVSANPEGWLLTFATKQPGFALGAAVPEDRGPGSFSATLPLGGPGEIPPFESYWVFSAEHLVDHDVTVQWPMPPSAG